MSEKIFAASPGATEMEPFATTRMACQPETMLSERQFLTVLGNVSYADRTHLKLLLKDGSGDILAELVRRDPD
jgi:heat shock protein HslJ